MNELQLVLFDDVQSRNWFPFTLTRPAGELRYGAFTQRERAERVFGARCIGHLADAALSGFDEPGSARVIQLGAIDTTSARLFLSARAVPSWSAKLPAHRASLSIGQESVGCFCPAGTPNPTEGELFGAATKTAFSLAGFVLQHIWEVMSRSAEQVATDVRHLHESHWSAPPAGVAVLGKPTLFLGDNVLVEPGVVLDCREGPIWLEDGVEVRAFTRLAGPAHIGAHTIVLGGRFTAVSIGPRCKVHGELEETVVLGYSNKAHDGFMGHAYIGKWVNLGAFTTNSDLKNNYSHVRVWTPDGEADTGSMKVGCFLGDHVKTAIGSLINTGTVVGPGSNLFGGMPPKFVPAFSWGSGLGVYEFDKFIATAELAMARRDVALSASQRDLLRAAWERARMPRLQVRP